jgi:acyl transferase domain-containing protein/SAM-dependent methyltransferase
MVDTRNEELSPVKRALLELREMRARLDEVQRRQHEPIAIIGVGLRFPGGANDLESFWRLLRDGVDAITEVPPDRWDINAYYDPDPMKPGKMSTRFGGFLDGIDLFDPQFFGISPREAASIDPQQRLLMETTWEALENAGQSPDRLFGSSTGVFVGISHSDYLHLIFQDINQIDVYSTTGSALSIAGGRLSYILGLQGPNICIDTACSSSLVAVHLAVQSLRLGESDVALAGGVGLILMPEITVNFSKSQMMAADGRCKTFDAAADGYVRGEGCGMIVLKRLSDALADGDHILAVIRGSAINQDGRSGGMTAPNGPSQESVISAALANARVKPEDVTYIEAHGTGTSLGDPIEVQALGAVFGAAHSADNPLMLGSVKTNVGHLEAAAGIAGLLKVVAALQHHEIPPHLNLKEPNPYIPWTQYPITVPTARTPWMPPVGKRLAGVSSFGFSGTNAHIVLEEAPAVVRESAPVERPLHLLTLSGRTPAALVELAVRYQNFFEQNPAVSFADACYTAAAGRAHFPHRLALVAESAQEAREKLAAYAAGEAPLGVFSGQAQGAGQPEVAFLFTGHGAQYLQMGRELYDTQPVFRAAIDRCDELLRPYLERSLLEALYPEAGQPSLMEGMAYTQPALFAIQVALADLWRSWSIEPTMVMGHSVGEYAAACVAGVFSLEDGLKLVAARGRLMESLPETGQMVAVFADENTVAQAVAPYADRVSMAVINGPQNIVISGAAEAVEAVVEKLKADKIKSRRLAVAQASHSPLIDPMLDEFEQVARTVTYAEPNLALLSCTTGQIVEPGEVTNAAYWRRHIRQPVRFATAMETLYKQGLRVFVEIGPNPTLLALGQRNLPDNTGVWLPSLREGVSDWMQMLESAGQLYIAGARLDWEGFDRGYARRRLPLPTYPFQRASYWADVARTSAAPSAPAWEAILTAGQHQAQQGPLDLNVQTYPQRWDCLDRLTTAHILNSLHELGVFTQAGEAHTLDELLPRFGIQPVYRNLMRRWLNKLVSLDLLAEREGTYMCSRPLPPADLDMIWDEMQRVMADLPFVLDYFGRCGSKLTAVITGAESPLETLFPGGSFALAEDLYQNWSLSRYYAGIARAVLEAVVRTLPPGKTLRVLEIGAGTGATTYSLLPVLPPERTVYTFTDVSDLFLAQSSQKFKAYPFVHYALLDIEQPPASQGFSPHGYDVIVAANVLHATRDLNQTLQNVQSLLAPGGLLLLDETTEHLPWFDMTTGLIGGWQRFEDNLRGDNPLLRPEQWTAVLEANGFSTVKAWPEAGAPTEILAQHIIVAQTGQTGYAEYGGADAAWQTGRAYDDGQSAAPENLAQEFMRQLQSVLPDERHDLMVDYVRQRVARVLRMDARQTLDRHQRLLDMGLDSLMALELRTLLSGGLDLSEGLPATLVFDYPTIDSVATYLEGVTGLIGEAGEQPADRPSPEQTAQATRAAEIADLSDEEVEALLLKKLRR